MDQPRLSVPVLRVGLVLFVMTTLMNVPSHCHAKTMAHAQTVSPHLHS